MCKCDETIKNWSLSLIVEVAAQDDLLSVGADGRVKLAADTAVLRGRRWQRHPRGGNVDVALGAADVGRDGGGRRLSEAILSLGNLQRVGLGVVPTRKAEKIITS